MGRLGRATSVAERLEPRRLLSREGPDDPFPRHGCIHGGGCGCGLLWTSAEPAPQWMDLTPSRESLTVPAFSSKPSAPVKIHLDFDGDFSATWGWGYSPGTTPAYDTDGDPSSFSDAELSDIRTIGDHVAEAFSFFNIDVTTIPPASLNNREAIRVVFGGDGAWFGSAGGVAYVDAFTNGAPNTVWAFSEVLFTPRNNAIVAVHEAGHAFGLYHQSIYRGNELINEYDPGDAMRGPFMGAPWSARRATWHVGFANQGVSRPVPQSDLGILSRPINGFTFPEDDHGDIAAHATFIGTSAGASAQGLIVSEGDVDVFRVEHAGGPFAVGVYRARDSQMHSMGMLATYAQVVDSSGNIHAGTGEANSDSVIQLPVLDAGTYFVELYPYGLYGDLGQYTLRVAPTIDVTPPQILSARLDFDVGPAIEYVFSEDVSASLSASDVMIYDWRLAAWIRDPVSVSWDPATYTARFQLRHDLPPSEFRFRLLDRAVSDSSFNESSVHNFDSWLLPGDANRDRTVDFADLLILAQNFGQSGRTFSQGNFDYSPDGLVGFSDLLIVAQNFNLGLLSPNATSRPAQSPMRVDREADALLT